LAEELSECFREHLDKASEPSWGGIGTRGYDYRRYDDCWQRYDYRLWNNYRLRNNYRRGDNYRRYDDWHWHDHGRRYGYRRRYNDRRWYNDRRGGEGRDVR
jgi:hypothetical protein